MTIVKSSAKKTCKHGQEMPQSQTTDQPVITSRAEEETL